MPELPVVPMPEVPVVPELTAVPELESTEPLLELLLFEVPMEPELSELVAEVPLVPDALSELFPVLAETAGFEVVSSCARAPTVSPATVKTARSETDADIVHMFLFMHYLLCRLSLDFPKPRPEAYP